MCVCGEEGIPRSGIYKARIKESAGETAGDVGQYLRDFNVKFKLYIVYKTKLGNTSRLALYQERKLGRLVWLKQKARRRYGVLPTSV